MAAFDFPSSPTVGDIYTLNGVTFRWNGYAWGGGPIVDSDAFVMKSGDTMTGALTIDPPSGNPQFILDKPASGQSAQIVGQLNGNRRWQMGLGNGTAESGGNAGSDFTLANYDDSGALLSTPIFVERATGKVTLGLNQIANVPQAFAHRSGAGAVSLGTGAWTKCNLGTLSTTGAAGYFSLAGQSLTILKPGVYFVWGSMLIQMPTTIGALLGGFGYNSNTAPSRYFRTQNAAANNYSYTFPFMGCFNCAANDFFTLMGFSSVAGATVADTAQETNLGAILLAAT